MGKSDEYAAARKKMVLYQIKYRGIKDPTVLNAMESVFRHEFVLSADRKKAYEDRPLPIGSGEERKNRRYYNPGHNLGTICPPDKKT